MTDEDTEFPFLSEVKMLGVGARVSPAPVWAQAVPHREAATTRSILSSRGAPGSRDLRGGQRGRQQTVPWTREEQMEKGQRTGRCQSGAVIVIGIWCWLWSCEGPGHLAPAHPCPSSAACPVPPRKPALRPHGNLYHWFTCRLSSERMLQGLLGLLRVSRVLCACPFGPRRPEFWAQIRVRIGR